MWDANLIWIRKFLDLWGKQKTVRCSQSKLRAVDRLKPEFYFVSYGLGMGKSESLNHS